MSSAQTEFDGPAVLAYEHQTALQYAMLDGLDGPAAKAFAKVWVENLNNPSATKDLSEALKQFRFGIAIAQAEASLPWWWRLLRWLCC